MFSWASSCSVANTNHHSARSERRKPFLNSYLALMPPCSDNMETPIFNCVVEQANALHCSLIMPDPHSRYAVVTLAIPNESNDLQPVFDATLPTIEAYADRIGQDFICIKERKRNSPHTAPHFEKRQVRDLLKRYERIIYVDADVVIRDNCPNLFGIVEEDAIGAFNELSQNNPNAEAIRQDALAAQEHLGRLKHWDLGASDGVFINSGVIVASRKHRNIFKFSKRRLWSKLFRDQTQINYNIQKGRFRIQQLPSEYNWMRFCKNTCPQDQAFIIHYAGKIEQQEVLRRIEQDLEPTYRNDCLSADETHIPEFIRDYHNDGSPTWEELKILKKLLLVRRPSKVLEVGSGCSTMLFADTMNKYIPNSQFTTLENSPRWHEALQERNKDHGYQFTSLHAPISDVTYGGKAFQSYDPKCIEKIPNGLEFVFIDGPSGLKFGRESVLYMLEERLAPGCLILLHDAARTNIEQKTIEIWTKHYGPQLSCRYFLDYAVDDHFRGKGLAILEWKPAS
jgi:predicted O-methyltransferase YrrM